MAAATLTIRKTKEQEALFLLFFSFRERLYAGVDFRVPLF